MGRAVVEIHTRDLESLIQQSRAFHSPVSVVGLTVDNVVGRILVTIEDVELEHVPSGAEPPLVSSSSTDHRGYFSLGDF